MGDDANSGRRITPTKAPTVVDVLDLALSAPQQPNNADASAIVKRLVELISVARQTNLPESVQLAAQRLREIAAERSLGISSESPAPYNSHTEIAEDVYLVRAFAADADQARSILQMQEFVTEAVVPDGTQELELDKIIAAEQLRFASLVPEPERLETAMAAFAHFRKNYAARYEAHHGWYWAETAKLHSRLNEARRQAAALHRLNSLGDLGPHVSAEALQSYETLIEDTAGCSTIGAQAVADGPICPSCGLLLGSLPPSESVADILHRVELGIERQMSRLSSVAVRQVMERSGDARIERFLKVVQAAQISSLVEILDDDLLGYLRRFLVEARINETLEPLLTRIQEGREPYGEETRDALDRTNQIIQRALGETQGALAAAEEEKPPRRTSSRKRG